MLKKGSVQSAVSFLRSMGRVCLVSAVFAFTFGLTLSAPAFAQGTDALSSANSNAAAVATSAGLPSTDLFTIIGRVINVVLGLTGVILLSIMLYAGYLWMTSGGESEKVEKARTMIKNAIIGLLIVVSAFAITKFIFDMLLGAMDGTGGIDGSGGGRRPSGFPTAAGSLGGGIVESHIPERNATGVARNTAIVVTFKEPIRLTSIIRDWNDAGTPADPSDDPTGVNDDAVKIFPNRGGAGSTLTSAQVRVRYTADHKTFVFRPVAPLGSPTENTDYTVRLLPGRTGVLLEDGTSAFSRSGLSGAGYEWTFQVSTVIDNTPPQVQSIIPTPGGTYAPNIIMQINFSEPVDPTSASGIISALGGFTNIQVTGHATSTPSAPDTRVYGEFKISNGYRTVEFIPTLSCGVNACGRPMFCLPFSNAVNVQVKAATLGTNPPQAEFSRSGYDGVVDLASNSLDGSDGHGGPADGIAQGSNTDSVPGLDDYTSHFVTTDHPNMDPPQVRSTVPRAGVLGSYSESTLGSGSVPVDLLVRANFDSVLQSSTVNTTNVVLSADEPTVLRDTFWWQARQIFLNELGTEATSGEMVAAGAITIPHRLFTPATSTLSATPFYNPFLYSGLQNIYQNCFNPSASPVCTGPYCCNNSRSEAACTFPHS